MTHDSQRAYNVARQIRAGNVSQAGHRIAYGLCFGGFKQSGVGREAERMA